MPACWSARLNARRTLPADQPAQGASPTGRAFSHAPKACTGHVVRERLHQHSRTSVAPVSRFLRLAKDHTTVCPSMKRPALGREASDSEVARRIISASAGSRKRKAHDTTKSMPRPHSVGNALGHSSIRTSTSMRVTMRGRADKPERFSMATLAPAKDACENAVSDARATWQAFLRRER